MTQKTKDYLEDRCGFEYVTIESAMNTNEIGIFTARAWERIGAGKNRVIHKRINIDMETGHILKLEGIK